MVDSKLAILKEYPEQCGFCGRPGKRGGEWYAGPIDYGFPENERCGNCGYFPIGTESHEKALKAVIDRASNLR